jgi:Kef-type K+ transport system membrane component KefB
MVKQNALVALGICCISFMLWFGLSQLTSLFSAGQLFGRTHGTMGPSQFSMITYESDPLNFLAALGAAALMTVFGLYLGVKLLLRLGQWLGR